jgi:hypothetical protein
MKRDQRITISEKKIFTRAFSRKFLPFRLKSIKWASFFQPSPFSNPRRKPSVVPKGEQYALSKKWFNPRCSCSSFTVLSCQGAGL